MQIRDRAELDAAPVGVLARHPGGVLVHVARRDDGARFCYVNGTRQLSWAAHDFPLTVLFDPGKGRVGEPATLRERLHVALVDAGPCTPKSAGLIRELVSIASSQVVATESGGPS